MSRFRRFLGIFGPEDFGLTGREIKVIRFRMGYVTGKRETLESTAEWLYPGLTRERIRQIEARALRKILDKIFKPLDNYKD